MDTPNASESRIQENRDTRPTPDPTVLTSQMISREIAWLRELFETRLDGLDRATALLQVNADKSPTIAELSARHDEKFRSITVQFAERDTRTEQTSRDSKVAVDAALQAAKEAVGEQNKSSALAIAKSEASTTKQIDQLAILLQSSNKTVDDKFSDLKDRLTSIEGRASGAGALWGFIAGAVGLAVGVGTLIGMFTRKVIP